MLIIITLTIRLGQLFNK